MNYKGFAQELKTTYIIQIKILTGMDKGLNFDSLVQVISV